MTIFGALIVLLCLGLDIVLSASIHRATEEGKEIEQIQQSEEVLLTTPETLNINCFSDVVKLADPSINPQQNPEKVLDEIENIGHIVPLETKPIESSQTISFKEENSKNVTFTGVLPKSDVIQDAISMNNEIIGIGPDTKIEKPPTAVEQEEEIGNEQENENENENTLAAVEVEKHEYDNLNFMDLLKHAVEDTASQYHEDTTTKEEIENDKLSWDLVEFLIMLTPTQDDKPISWWRILVEAVQCSMRHCSIGGPKMTQVHLPKIIRRRRMVQKCKCQALEKLFEMSEMLDPKF